MTDQSSAEDRLTRLRGMIVSARSMPMSASCVVNRGEVLAALDAVLAHLPAEVAGAQQVLDRAESQIAEGQEEAGRIVAGAREQATQLALDTEVVRVAEERAERMMADAKAEAEALRRETDAFVDARMASFESVLHKTSSQVRTARARLAERSGLDGHQLSVPVPAPPSQ